LAESGETPTSTLCFRAGFKRGGLGLHFLGNADEPVRLRLVGQLLGEAASAGGQLP
jgi:hypothetical protein